MPPRRHGRLRGVPMSARLLPAVRDFIGPHPRAARLSAEQVAGLLWVRREEGRLRLYTRLEALREAGKGPA